MKLLSQNITVKVKAHPLMKPLRKVIKNSLYTIAEGGRYGGKTYTCAMIALLDGIDSKEEFVIVCIAPQQGMLDTGLKENMKKIISDFGLNDLIIINNSSRLVLNLGDHTIRIEFKYGASQPERLLKSIFKVNRFVIDEGQLYSFLFFDYARGTLREKDGKILIMANLNHENSWVYYMCRKDGALQMNNQYQKVLEKKGKTSNMTLYGVFRMPYYSNPFLPEHVLDMIEAARTSPNKVDREWYLVEIMNQLPSHQTTLIFSPELFDFVDVKVNYDYLGRPFVIPQHAENKEPYFIEFKRGIDFGGTAQGTGHNGAIVEGFFVKHEGYNRHGVFGEVVDLYIHKAVVKQMPENVDYLHEIKNRTNWFQDNLCGYMDKTRAGALGQFQQGELGYPSLHVDPASQGKDSVEDSNFYLRSLNKIYINFNAQVDDYTGREHCDDISYEIRNYRYKADKNTGKPVKNENTGKLEIRKLDDDFFSALRYSIDEEFLAFKTIKEKKLTTYHQDDSYYDNISSDELEHNYTIIG